MTNDLRTRQINTIRALALDAVKKANSGHTGTAMALAPLADVLFTKILKYDAAAPMWPDRDRFVLSAGHASMLLYSMLYLTGYGITLDDIQNFRQWGSLTPGHPEVGLTPGVEVTTGPLGQGVANAVGMALAERHLRARLGSEIVDHRTWAICGDGDLMEGVSHEAASLAGHQQLGGLVLVYDDNQITIDGPTSLTFSDDTQQRFESYGWHVLDLGEAAEDTDRLESALNEAAEIADRPSLVIVRSHIGFPAPTAVDTPGAHGAITDDQEIAAAKTAMGFDPEVTFRVDDDVLEAYRKAGARGVVQHADWKQRVADSDVDPGWIQALLTGSPLPNWSDELPNYEPGTSIATRNANNHVIDALVDVVPSLVSGSADLTGNTGTNLAAEALTPARPEGRKLYYGIREHAMGSVANGMALHGGVLPVVGTFLVFADYMRPSVRMAALSGAKAIFVWSHDSIGVGEDGPTHQPVEQVASLRAIPDLPVVRPADANEVSQTWNFAIENNGPIAVILTRQNVPVLEGTSRPGQVQRGAYVLIDAPDPAVILAGTGSEVQLCVEAAGSLAAEGIASRVVSMPCWELFADQEETYRFEVFPPGLPVVGVEAGVSLGWDRWADVTVTIDQFGASAPGSQVMEEFGFSAASVEAAARSVLQ
ncbi:MAG: transketolase [Actinomycetota bacterium]|nr:transketolase [Acidimicrobiales bacterium]MEC8923372.1 transketolase [Actinomycetota bacterium]MEC9316260.1 transketolase [Actinomycetota bacterium]MEE3187576.1 transketolase [Actinomycetota bacterium]